MKKILITIPWFLPAYRAGGPIRSIANLVENYKEASFFIFTSDTDISGAALENVETGKWLRWNRHTHVWYATHGRASHQLTRQAARLKPDIIFMVGMYSWHFSLVPLLYCKAPRKIMSVRGMLHPGALTQKSIKKKIFLRAFTLFEYNHRITFHATDEREQSYIQQTLGEVARVFVAGNFPSRPEFQPPQPKLPGVLKLVTIALVSPMKNILRVLHALKGVKAKIDYRIYGAIKDEDYWIECKAVMGQLPQNISVEYGGALHPDQVPEALGESHVFILPSESENFGHAIFEALSAGRPVITSHTTPFNELKQKISGMNVNADNEDDIAAAIEAFAAMDQEEYSRWSAAAKRYASQRIDRDQVMEEYRKMFDGRR